MYTTYDNLPKDARIWVYQADRSFTNEEVAVINAKAKTFIENWTRHGDDLKGSFLLKYNQFLILAIDQSFNTASGCSIDASVRFVKDLETELSVDLMDKMNISFKDGANINVITLADFQAYAKQKKIHADTIVFNNMVATKEGLEHNWEVPASASWHKRFLG
ncbi:ABC transporter ATPase [Tenacibaculum sp. SG-28]|uniref:ABC transporter ATPase n=1 Tax=Tenacibaculum sp. SG-28 TaxID=754426 RepID=UPI000CF48EB5|nr:ABC transporter ATPase [Tenacibaculum sp. SG-28]PQJ23038.1 ABC transporter ATPase [Tenacibaculum sp. SG-28]